MKRAATIAALLQARAPVASATRGDEDERPIHSAMLKTLCAAINRWDDYADEYDDEKRVETTASGPS